MRRWHLLNRLRRAFAPRDLARCILVVEQLEAREVLSPFVIAPEYFPVIPEGGMVLFGRNASIGDTSFSVLDPAPLNQDYTATLTATNGTLAVILTSTVTGGLKSITGNGTSTVTLKGPVASINSALHDPGITFTSTPFFSGNAAVTVSVADPTGGPPGEGTLGIRVTPVVSPANIEINAFGEQFAPASGFAFPPGFVTVAPWPDADGSETVTLTFGLEPEDPNAVFTLSAGGVAIAPLEQNLWQISGSDPAAFQALLNSLVLTPPAGFTGRAFLNVFGNINDQATFSSDETQGDFRDLGSGQVDLRFFIGGSVTTPPAFALEGGTIDLGGRFVATDPDDLPGDFHTLTLSAPAGSLTFDPDAAATAGVSVERRVGSDGSTTLLIDGDLASINAFLAAAGSVTYTPATPFFSGVVPLSVTLTNHPGQSFEGPGGMPGFPAENVQTDAPNPFNGTVALTFVPVADHVFPSAADVTTPQDTPVAVSISVSALADTDGSESVLIMLDGVPAGATFNHGTDLGGGQWALSPADLAGLTFTPPPGTPGVYSIVVKAVVTDSAPGLASDTATESTSFTIIVTPTAVVPVVPPVVPKLPPAPVAAGTVGADIVQGAGTTSADTDTTSKPDTARPDVRPVVATLDVYAPGPNDQVASTETRVSQSPPSQGSLFAQAEVPLPIYGSGEKHPLPPVLPLDQTLPVAGFSESGGDSFALVDKLYRDAAGNPVSATPAAPQDALAEVAGLVEPIRVAVAPPAAPRADANATAGEETAPPVAAVAAAAAEAAEEQGGQWRAWAAASAIAGSLVAWAWLARGTDDRLSRAVRRLLRLPHRRPTQRTA